MTTLTWTKAAAASLAWGAAVPAYALVFSAPEVGTVIAPVNVTRNAVNLLGPGHNSGTGRATSTGTTVTATTDKQNRSGAPITSISLVLSGWWLGTAGTSVVGNDYPVTATIQYPVGTTIATITSGGGSTIIVPNGTDVVTDAIDISATPIPANATFRVALSSTTANGLFYANNTLGLTGVLTTALSSTLKKEMLFAIGDSIMTGASAAVVHTVANTSTGCPSMQMSIAGTTAQTYSTNFTRQVALARRLGATRIVSNFGTNDLGAGRTLAQLQGYLTAMKALADAEGIAWSQCTMTPRTGGTTVTATAATGTTNSITLTVPNASLFDVGLFYTVAGAVQTGYNGTRVCSAVNTGANTVTFISSGVSASPATGTITVVSRTNNCSTRLQSPQSWESSRVAFNEWVRAGNLGLSYIDWADGCEPSRNAGRWATGKESAFLRNPGALGTVSSIITTSRFNSTGTGIIGNGGAAGALSWASGPNIGLTSSTNGSSGGDITLSAAPTTATAVGHQFYVFAIDSYATDDGLHPKQGANGKGGNEMVGNPTTAWLTTLLA